jgi:hypothetical protein
MEEHKYDTGEQKYGAEEHKYGTEGLKNIKKRTSDKLYVSSVFDLLLYIEAKYGTEGQKYRMEEHKYDTGEQKCGTEEHKYGTEGLQNTKKKRTSDKFDVSTVLDLLLYIEG